MRCPGFKQGSNEPCLFVNPVTGLKLVIYCDDFLYRGSGPESAKFHAFLCMDLAFIQRFRS